MLEQRLRRFPNIKTTQVSMPCWLRYLQRSRLRLTLQYPRSTNPVESLHHQFPLAPCSASLGTMDRLTRLWISFECFTSGNRPQDKKGVLHAPPGGWQELYWGVLAPGPTCRFKDCPMIHMEALRVLCLIRFVQAWAWSLLREISVGDNKDLHLMNLSDAKIRWWWATSRQRLI